ncbi:peptide chain release factor 1 [candidate division WOR-3 bacterium]|nr:peptide chain release factor 1 [candidate division WOR-3 bacterium]MCK4529182.1 peptide chain release factor 1 [candidate division WOR-3 bacterium]
MFLDKIDNLKEKYEKILNDLQTPEILKDREKLIELSRAKKSLEDILNPYEDYKGVMEKIEEDEDLIREVQDEELVALAEEEIEELNKKKEELEKQIKEALIPDDPDANKNAVLEIRAGTGGEEAALFSADLLRMYQRFSETKGWKFEIVDYNRTDMNGYKEIIALISGKKVYGQLRFESGVHRVQRVPVTESGGRIHTSAVTVAVLPEREEVEVEIDPKDLRTDFYSASGPGGQHVNRSSTAVRLEHIPTGIVVACQDERSQHQNRIKAMRLLRARLYEMEKQKEEKERKSKRKSLIGTGDRSEKIRTYNFPQNRITDHRIDYTKYNLDAVLNGNLRDLIDSLVEAEREQVVYEIN